VDTERESVKTTESEVVTETTADDAETPAAPKDDSEDDSES